MLSSALAATLRRRNEHYGWVVIAAALINRFGVRRMVLSALTIVIGGLLLAKITAQSGWRTSLALVCAMLVVATLIALTLLRERPVDAGLGASRAITPRRARGSGALRQRERHVRVARR
jgi:sugar phosphate permease